MNMRSICGCERKTRKSAHDSYLESFSSWKQNKFDFYGTWIYVSCDVATDTLHNSTLFNSLRQPFLRNLWCRWIFMHTNQLFWKLNHVFLSNVGIDVQRLPCAVQYYRQILHPLSGSIPNVSDTYFQQLNPLESWNASNLGNFCNKGLSQNLSSWRLSFCFSMPS